jgi:hypothetical protein
MSLTSDFSTNVLKEIEDYSLDLYAGILNALAHHTAGEVVGFTLTLTLPDTDAFAEEMGRVARLPE